MSAPPTSDVTPTTGRSRSGSGLRFFLVVWLLLAAAGAAWSFTTPLFASPDEAAHVVKAVAVADGQFAGETVRQPGEYFPIMTRVMVPEYYGTARSMTDCFIWDTLQAASCAPDFAADDRGTGPVDTWMGRYPPAYYLVAGLPSRFLDGEAAVLAMRTTGAVACAALLAAGITALRSSRHPVAFMGAGLIGVTPTSLFLVGMVNPTGLEIAAGFALWCILLPLVLDPAAHRVGARLVAAAATAVVLVNTRPGSALMAVLIAVPVALVATRSFWQAVSRNGVWKVPVAVAAAGGLAAGAWLLVEDPTASFGGDPAPELASPAAAFVAGFARSGRYLEEQLGVFGRLNLPAPPLVFVLLCTALVALIGASVVLGRGRWRWAVVVAVVLVVLVPVVSQIPSAARLGLIWQGRYILPVSCGLPLLAMAALADAPRSRRFVSAGGVLLCAIAVASHIGALGWSLWRYAFGFGRSPLAAPPFWQPPGGVLLWLTVSAVSIGGLGVVLALGADSPLRRLRVHFPGRRGSGATVS
jgi:hypothetical protein